ncbi:MAG: hypothetical protein JO276_16295 [Sphingomonadaceae bacterium]|nr:hypothetical protein [Sphingomonadaceae bacterium]
MRTALLLASMLCAAGCASQSGGPVQLVAGQQGDRCTATVEGRPVVFNTDGSDFRQLQGRAVTIAASGNLPNRCVGLLIAALQRAGTGPVTYDGHGQAQVPERTARDDARRPLVHRASASSWDERPSFDKRSRRSEWRGSTMSNSQSGKSARSKASTKAPSAGR